MLLIVTNRGDLACDYLILRLNERKIPFVRFNTDLYPDAVSFDISLQNGQSDFAIRLDNGKELRANSINAVYFRQPIAPTFEDAANASEKEFAEAELTEMLRSLWRVIPEKLWLNHPRRLWLASNKVEQLLAAKSVGFWIPDTLISFSSDSISEFVARKNKRVVGKAVRHGFISSEDEVLLAGTQRLPEDFVDQHDRFATIPMTYQEELEKGVDLRVVVVGNHVFATAITIEDHNDSSVDWRISELTGGNLIHERTDLPDFAIQQCLSIVKHFGLNYSSIDLIKDRQGRYFFLELNPNGQWAWIEQIVDYPIRDAIIDTLLTE